MTIRENASGLFTITLRPCTSAVVSLILPESDATVWIRGHRPEPSMRWCRTPIALRPDGAPVDCLVRGLEVDLQFPVARFKAVLSEFEHWGVDLLLLDRPVAPTLTLEGLDRSSATRVLLANGLLARFDLPHANETAVLAVRDRRTLEDWVAGPLRNWVAP